jgi:acyl-CoA-binding protein
MNDKNKKSIDELLKAYALLVRGIEGETNQNNDRAYGGVVCGRCQYTSSYTILSIS